MTKTLIALIFCILCAACGGEAQHQTIRFAIAQAPLNCDPRYATDAASERLNRLLYQPLVDFDEASKPAPVLARWAMVSSTEYQYTLIKNATFHHGKALTSADVKATYESLQSLKDAPHAAEFANVESIETPNKTSN